MVARYRENSVAAREVLYLFQPCQGLLVLRGTAREGDVTGDQNGRDSAKLREPAPTKIYRYRVPQIVIEFVMAGLLTKVNV